MNNPSEFNLLFSAYSTVKKLQCGGKRVYLPYNMQRLCLFINVKIGRILSGTMQR